MEKEKAINDFFAGIIRPIVTEAVKASMPQPEKEPEKEYLSIKEIMELCGCCHSSVYNHIRAKHYKIVKHFGRSYVKAKDIMADFKEPVLARNTNTLCGKRQ